MDKTEHMINIKPVSGEIKWSKDPKCQYAMTQIYLDVLKKYGINETKTKDWMLYFPCSYNFSQEEIDKINPTDVNQRIFIVNNANSLASKSDLWINIVAKHGREKAKIMAPLSYVLYDKKDLDLFKKEYDSNKIYIIKKNIQRQEGLKITNNKEEILNAYNDNYVIAQELLQDPYIIRDRKTNMRFYVLVMCQNNEISLYIHDDGFMYYTKMPFKKGSMKMWSNITTGYIDRWIYHINPLSHKDFRKYLDDSDIKSDIVFAKIYDLIKDIVLAMDNKICHESKLKPYISFQLFGADIALDNMLNPKIMEFNIGPNLATHDNRDKEIKHKVVEDIFKTLKIVPDINNGFIKLI